MYNILIHEYFFILIIIIISILYYLKSFLITRYNNYNLIIRTQLNNINFNNLYELMCENCVIDDTIFNNYWKYNKVVFLLIDALRYDFVKPSDNEKYFYENNMKKAIELLNKEKENTHLFKFIADAPTTTSNRLYGIAAGTIPSFLDIKDNFAASELKEDNLLLQLNKANKK